jgi:small subunit ribosomal protein S2
VDEVSKLARAGKTILFAGTKKQSQDIIKTEAVRCGMPYVTYRWLGGMLTNFTTIRRSISRMEEIETMRTDGTYDELTKKETLMLDREQNKLEETLVGIANMNHLPGAIFVVDINKEDIAVKEAIKLHIPIIAMVDTNSDPDIPDYIIPSNDDSARTIQLVTATIADAIIAGNAEREVQKEEDVLERATAEEEQPADLQAKTQVKPTGKRRSRRRRRREKTSSEEEE